VELPRSVHPFYIGTQAHPELRSRPNHAHPLFRGLIGAALDRQHASRLFEVSTEDSEELSSATPVADNA
jgi:CTP synthase